jgi:hypothetical protein
MADHFPALDIAASKYSLVRSSNASRNNLQMKSIEMKMIRENDLQGLTESPGESFSRAEIKDLESKYLTAIKKLIDKHEGLYNSHDTYKSEMSEKLNHYIALNNSLYSRNTELAAAAKEKQENVNKLNKENMNLKDELEAKRITNEKLKKQLNESVSQVNLLEKFSASLKSLYAQREEELVKAKTDFQNLEQKSLNEKNQITSQRNSWMDKCARMEDEARLIRAENKTALQSFSAKLAERDSITNELEHALVESNTKLSNLLYENEALKNSMIDSQLKIEDLEKRGLPRPKEFTYEGKIVNGLRQGKGIYQCPEYVYEGEFKNDNFCGEGRYVCFQSGKTMDGVFDENGHFTGSKVSFTGFTYTGNVIGNYLEGKGYIEVENRYIIEGRFKNNSFDRETQILVVNLTSGEEVETKWQSSENILVGGEPNQNIRFLVDFRTGVFKDISN